MEQIWSGYRFCHIYICFLLVYADNNTDYFWILNLDPYFILDEPKLGIRLNVDATWLLLNVTNHWKEN